MGEEFKPESAGAGNKHESDFKPETENKKPVNLSLTFEQATFVLNGLKAEKELLIIGRNHPMFVEDISTQKYQKQIKSVNEVIEAINKFFTK